MAERAAQRRSRDDAVLKVSGLHVYYGQSHALQGVNLTLEQGVHAVVGRNGMGKTTLCDTIMGLLRPKSGSIRFHGEEIGGEPSYRIAARGIGYTPQGRRLWPSLSVAEHLALSDRGGVWTTERIYEIFPRLAERRQNGAGQLSGGEQQMLAISRALLQDPELLVLDEPTEGLAPVIVEHVERVLADLAAERDVSILLIEQNIAVATAIAKDVAIMVNGRISRVMPAEQLASDRHLQERLLGVGRHSLDDVELADVPADMPTISSDGMQPPDSYVKPQRDVPTATTSAGNVTDSLVYVPPTRWSSAVWNERTTASASTNRARDAVTIESPVRPFDNKPEPLFTESLTPLDALLGEDVYVAGTFDTKGVELNYIRDQIANHGLRVKTVDLSTSGKPSAADVPPHLVAAYCPGGASAVFTGDRGGSVGAMAEAFKNWLRRQRGIAGVISAGGSGGTSLVTPAMRALPVGVPKVMVSTVASGDVGRYVGPSDIMMMYSVTDVQGLNRISRKVLTNAANALAGMVMDAGSHRGSKKSDRKAARENDKPGLGLTMFGVTTTAVQQITSLLESDYDCLVFHATGTGGRSMEKLVDSGMLSAAIDLTTTEICDMLMGGVFRADEDRFGAFIRNRIPYVGSVGALDMVNFGARDTVPERYASRTFVEHNPQVTLMRTTAEENVRMGEWIVARLNQMTGPVRFVLPEGGVSALDKPGQPFHDPQANSALFDTINRRFEESSNRRLIRTPHHINDPEFARVIVDALEAVNPLQRTTRNATF
ncbi:MAG: hypothetical protein DHS20C01_28490 [marine bacterium B5-7]|nr:MAG: hypothetical protein DHS20C01_28490 [marine bacterium B5-7]